MHRYIHGYMHIYKQHTWIQTYVHAHTKVDKKDRKINGCIDKLID